MVVSVGARSLSLLDCIYIEESNLWLWLSQKWTEPPALTKLALVSCCLYWWRASCCIFSVAGRGLLWGRMNTQSWCKGRVCKKAGKTWDWIFSICLISLPVTWRLILHPSHWAAKLQPDHSIGMLCSRSEELPIFMCPYKLTAVRLGGRKSLFQRVQHIAWVMAQKTMKKPKPKRKLKHWV